MFVFCFRGALLSSMSSCKQILESVSRYSAGAEGADITLKACKHVHQHRGGGGDDRTEVPQVDLKKKET